MQRFLAMVVQQVMTQSPATVEVSDSLGRVEGVLLELDVRHVPVMDHGELKGIISDRDLGPWRTEDYSLREAVRAGQVMSADLITVNPESELAEVVDTMLDHKVGALPVVDASTQALVGIVSYIDVLRAVRAAL
jgi:CBS domain-containing protein